MTEPAAEPAAKACSICKTVLTKANSHCTYRGCPWCETCAEKRDIKRAGRPPLHT